MGKKKSLSLLPSSLFRAPRNQPWQQFLPSCGFSPKTLSFHATSGDDIFKTVNSVFFDAVETAVASAAMAEPWFTTSSESAASCTTESDVDGGDGEESVETVVRGVRSSTMESKRLFFHPEDNKSILEKSKANIGFPFKESEVLAMESGDPYGDFKKSMEEMVESHGIKNWDGLEELLGWYLKVNERNNHRFIIGAFVDLLVSLLASNNNTSTTTCSESASSSTSYFSVLSSFSSSSSSPLFLSHSQTLNSEIVDEEEDDELMMKSTEKTVHVQ